MKTIDERHERELLNRRRTWMICSIIDGSTSLETGKAPEVGRDEEVLLGHCRQPLVKLTHCWTAHIERIPLVLSLQVPTPIRCGPPRDHRASKHHAPIHGGNPARWLRGKITRHCMNLLLVHLIYAGLEKEPRVRPTYHHFRPRLANLNCQHDCPGKQAACRPR